MSLLVPDPGQHNPGLAQGSAAPQPGPLVDEGDKGWDRCFTSLLVYTETNGGEISSSALWARKLSQRIVTGGGQIGMEEHKIPALAQLKPRGKRLPTPPAAKSALTELSQLCPTCKKGGLQPFCWSSFL